MLAVYSHQLGAEHRKEKGQRQLLLHLRREAARVRSESGYHVVTRGSRVLTIVFDTEEKSLTLAKTSTRVLIKISVSLIGTLIFARGTKIAVVEKVELFYFTRLEIMDEPNRVHWPKVAFTGAGAHPR